MFSAGGAGRRVERRSSVEPSRPRRPTERARAARVSVAATSGEQQRCEVWPAREPEASVRRRRAERTAAPRRVGAFVSCVRVCVERAACNVPRAKRGAQCVACDVWCARCGAVGARAGSECEAAVGRRACCVTVRQRVVVRVRVGGERWCSRCRVRGVGRRVAVREALRTVRRGRRASWKRVRGGGGLGACCARRVGSLVGVCACVRANGAPGRVRGVLRARGVLHTVRCGLRASRRRMRGGGGLKGPPRRGASGRSWSCVRVCVERAACNVLRAKRGAQSVACEVCCARCGAVGARAGSECEAAAG